MEFLINIAVHVKAATRDGERSANYKQPHTTRVWHIPGEWPTGPFQVPRLQRLLLRFFSKIQDVDEKSQDLKEKPKIVRRLFQMHLSTYLLTCIVSLPQHVFLFSNIHCYRVFLCLFFIISLIVSFDSRPSFQISY